MADNKQYFISFEGHENQEKKKIKVEISEDVFKTIKANLNDNTTTKKLITISELNRNRTFYVPANRIYYLGESDVSNIGVKSFSF